MLKTLFQKIVSLNYLHPLLFAIYPLLAFYTANIEKMRFSRIMQPLEISLAFTIGLWLLLNSLVKNKYKTSLLATYLLILFYSYGHTFNLLEGILFKNVEDESNVGLFSVWLLLLISGGFMITKLQKSPVGVTNLLSKIGMILIFIPLLQIFYFNLKFNKILFSVPVIEEISDFLDPNDQEELSNRTDLPDIYYIILDGYANNQTLRNIYQYDNGEFTDFLTSKNFNVAFNARSNYALTFLSLASSLNMRYVNYLSDLAGEDSVNRIIATEMIKDSEVLKFLKIKGYQSTHFSSGWGATNRNRFADLNIYCVRNNEFISTLSMTTMLRPFENMFLMSQSRERILCTFARLATLISKDEKPIFVFAHIISPHPPFVFDADGGFIKDPSINKGHDMDNWKNKEPYINQLKFINIKVKELITKLTADKNNLPIIIIQADHGSASTPGMEEYNPELIQERMRPFVATYLPGKDNFIPDSVTPVNIFRLIFKNYFNAKYEPLENKVYFSTYGKPYKFIDVTDEIWKLPPK